MKRSGLRRTVGLKRTPLKRRTPLAPTIGMPYSLYLQTWEWFRIRLRVFTRDGKKCRVCGSTRKIQAHHRSYGIDVMLGRDLDGLITLCAVHHREVEYDGSRRRGPRERERVLKEMLDG